MPRTHRYSPYLDDSAGNTLPAGDPQIREDFIRQHMIRGWRESEARARYERWRRGEVEPQPLIPSRNV